ncbi:MAG TPA: HEAT repeat domain-containing protein [Archangium sp.]|nr:HEAT repeat domain-containing protein [Archangium sp.]
MNNLSPRARALLEALTAWGPHDDSLLPTLGAQHEPTLVLPLFRKLFSAPDDQARSLAIALHHLLSHLGPEDVRGLDEALRQVSFYETGYLDLGAQELDRLAALSPSVVTLLTCHPSGYMRQPALLHLARSGNVAAWPFLLLRLNDWVLPVREAARQAATAALPRVPLELLARHFPLVEALRHFQRADHLPFVEAVMARLCQPDALTWLEKHLDGLKWHSRRTAFRLLLKGPEERARRAAERGLEDSDPVVRRLAVARVEDLFSEEELPRVLARMERSHSMFMRREAYSLYVRRMPALAEAKVREALMDPHHAIRDYAQRRLSGTVEVSGLYRAALRETPTRPGALAGLGETGSASDVPLLAPFLAHPRVAVRREAVTALGRLAGDSEVEALRELFLDPAPSVCRAAAHALASRAGRVTPDWLRRCLFLPGLAPHTLRQALQLIDALPRFEALHLLLDALALPDETARARIREHLRSWLLASFRSFSASPSAAQVRALREAVRTARHLEPEMARQLDHQLRAYEP